jgi:pimeloyl-ACP methyl ester carboxylesterase
VLIPLAALFVAAAPDALLSAPSRYAPLDRGRVHYKSLGRGPATVVFVHGWSCSLGVWRLQAAAFAARARALFVDLPGHGGSDAPPGPAGQDLFARALDAVLRDAGAESAIVVGHSNGVITARHFYRLYPARTRALVLVDGNLRPFVELSRYPSIAAGYDVPGYRSKVGRVAEGMVRDPSLRAELRRLMSATPRRTVVSSLAELKDPGVWAPDTIGVPVLALHAAASHWTPDYEAFVRRIAPGVDYRVWDGVGHFMMMERSSDFDATVLGFLESRGLL